MYVARAVTIPVWGSADEQPFADFCAALAEQWGEATRLANWIHTTRYARDVRREPGMAKLPPMPAVYLYPEARAAFPHIMPSVVTAIDHAETGKYRANRWDILWAGKASLANVRYPTPLPLPADTIGFERDPDNQRVSVAIRFGTASEGTRWKLRLAGGRDYARQLAAVEKMMTGDIELIEGALLRKSAKVSDGRSGGTSGDDKPNAKPRIMLKLVGWFPVTDRREQKAKFLSLSTGTEEFLLGIVEGREEPWCYHADHVRDWIYQHERNRWRIQADQKATGWRPKRRRKQAKQSLSDRIEKHRARIDEFVKQTAAMVLKFAASQGVTRIKYSDRERGYFPSFPWDRLRQQLSNKCEESGILLEVASAEVVATPPGAARKKRKVKHDND